MGEAGPFRMATVPGRSDRDKERVRDASDIVRVVGELVALKAKGREYVGLCPFHDDHRPSMNVVPAKQIFHCFVCGAGGDVFSFIQRYHNMEFREALEHLAERAGIALTSANAAPEAGTAPTTGVTRADLVRANTAAHAYFRALWRHAEHGREARELAQRRGIGPEMIEAFGLGASAARWDGLVLSADRLGMPLELLAAAGLVKPRESGGGHYDAFRNRLMFPIIDEAGRVIAFGARRIDENDDPKYLNSAESKVFEKSSTLYGLHQAARAIQAERTAVVTEGYTDTIACHQAGIRNVVATLGTALTTGHAGRLRRHCDTVVLLFDGDDAGQRAADRAVEVFIKESLDVRIATLARVTDAKDPDELLKRPDGADLLRRAIDQAEDLLAYRYGRLRAAVGPDAGPAAVTRIVQEELDRLVQIGLNELVPVRRRLILRQLAGIAGIDESSILRMIPAGREASRRAADPEARRISRPKPEQLLGCLLLTPSLWATLTEEDRAVLTPERIDDALVRRVAEVAWAIASAEGSCGLDRVLLGLDHDTDAKAEAVALTEHVSQLTRDGHGLSEHWDECLRYMRLDEASRPVGGREKLQMLRAREAGLGVDRRIVPRATWAG
jgi:DNA primase